MSFATDRLHFEIHGLREHKSVAEARLHRMLASRLSSGRQCKNEDDPAECVASGGPCVGPGMQRFWRHSRAQAKKQQQYKALAHDLVLATSKWLDA